jgi:hypothetical protein
VFICTTNEFNYLHDQTGNRRFHPVVAKSIDLENLKTQLPQIWAEAYKAYLDMRSVTPKGEPLPLYLEDGSLAHGIVETMRGDRMEDNPADGLSDRIVVWLDKPSRKKPLEIVSAPQLWVEALGRDMRDYGKGPGKIVGTAMAQVPHWRNLGRQRTKNGGITRLWCRNDGGHYQATDYYWAGLNAEEALSEAAGKVGI